jgi:hypothetical protein
MKGFKTLTPGVQFPFEGRPSAGQATTARRSAARGRQVFTAAAAASIQGPHHSPSRI